MVTTWKKAFAGLALLLTLAGLCGSASASASRPWSAPDVLAKDSDRARAVGANRDGDAAAAWTECKLRSKGGLCKSSSMLASLRRSGERSFGGRQVLVENAQYISSVDVAVGQNGLAVLVFGADFGGKWHLMLARQQGSQFEAPRELTAGEIRPDPVVAIGPTNEALIFWVGGPKFELINVAMSASGELGAPEVVPGTDKLLYTPRIAIDATGSAIAVFALDRSIEGKDSLALRYPLYLSVRPAGGRFGAAQKFASDYTVDYPDVVFERDGTALIEWSQDVRDAWQTKAVELSPSGKLSTVRAIKGECSEPSDAIPYLDRTGGALLFWSCGGQGMQFSYAREGNQFGRARQLVARKWRTDGYTGGGTSTLAVDRKGDLTAWRLNSVKAKYAIIGRARSDFRGPAMLSDHGTPPTARSRHGMVILQGIGTYQNALAAFDFSFSPRS